ncbi:amidase family protein, partial [Corynebacterium otitidis]|uniref:amidase family protein n=1 Tax=Corynebacterium otitidis TaxID=29321 RepID=UPI000571F021
LRVPAAACGLVGFKPAHRARRGRLAASGVITRTVADQALVHGLEPARPGRVRVGVLTEPLFGRRSAGPRWAEAARRAAALLEEAGVPTMPVRPHPDAAGFFAVFRVLVLAGADAAAPGTSPLVAYLARLREGLDRRAFARAAHAQQQILPAARRFWPVDALLTPTLAFDPPELGAFSRLSPEEDFLAQTDWTPWGSLANLTGAPAISVPMPAGDGQRLPPSIQLIGLNLGDSRLLGLAGLLAA